MSDLLEMLGASDDEIKKVDESGEAEWKKYWKGMPEFEQENKETYKTIYVHFRTKEAYDEFAKIIGQTLTDKTKSIWHPELEITKNSLLRWVQEEE